MNNKNHLNYFLNNMKEELDFKDAEDFNNKVHLKSFKLSDKKVSRNLPKFVLENVKTNLNSKILDNMKLFGHFDINYNQVFVLGSFDYLRIVLREENLNKYLKEDLFNEINRYVRDIEKIYSLCNGDNEVLKI